MGQRIIPLEKVTESSGAGGKALGLGQLLQACLSVPPGFVVVFDKLNETINTDEVLRAYDLLNVPWVAVRSSAAQEDGKNASWAGQLQTFLYVNRESVVERINDCVEAAKQANQGSYAKRFGSDETSMGVIVQAMVDSEISGVAFSAHPVSGDSGQIVIEAGLGLGEAIVSGEITPDTYVIETATGNIVSALVATQAKKLQLGQTGGTSWETITPAASQQKLTTEQLSELSQLVKKLATYYDYPVDVEWAWAAEQLYVLQCRPLTTLP